MSWNYYPRYVPVAEKRAKAAKKLAKLKKKNPDIRPVVISGRTIAASWWGKAWNNNLGRYADYSNRIGRGRSYVRNGSVLDLQIDSGEVKALVQGSSTYNVTVNIAGIKKNVWDDIKTACQGKFDSLPALLDGKFPKALAEIFTEKGKGLFPSPEEIKFSCSCPDWAYMCKHVAATLYGIGARLDHDPMLFFKLRDADVGELISEAAEDRANSLLKKAEKKSARVMENADLGELFGIDLENAGFETGEVKSPKKPAKKRKPARKKAEQPAAPKKKSGSVKKKTVKSKQSKPSEKNSPTEDKAMDEVCEIIRKSRQGADIQALQKKTGFDEDDLWRIVLKLSARDMIFRAEKGKYKPR